MIESLFTLLFVVVFGFITLAAFPLVVDWITGPVRISPSRRINKIVNGGHAPPDPAPDRCHLTEQIHAAARDAGLCVDCGETREKCAGFMPEVSVGSPMAPRWVCGVNNPIRSALLHNQKTEADFAFIRGLLRSGGTQADVDQITRHM